MASTATRGLVLGALLCNASIGSILASEDRLGVANYQALVRRREVIWRGRRPAPESVWTEADARLQTDLAGGLTGSGLVIARGMLSGGLVPPKLMRRAPIGSPDRLSVTACCVESRSALLLFT